MCLICRGENLEGLTILSCFGCPNLTRLPLLPASLTSINCFNCPNLISLPILPASLTTLFCPNCPNLTSLPILPDSLIYLYCSNTSITVLPTLPASLQKLQCSNCPKLISLPLLPASLITLYCRNKWLSIKGIGVLNPAYSENIRKLSIVQRMIKKHYLRHKFTIRIILRKHTVIPMAIIDSICREYL